MGQDYSKNTMFPMGGVSSFFPAHDMSSLMGKSPQVGQVSQQPQQQQSSANKAQTSFGQTSGTADLSGTAAFKANTQQQPDYTKGYQNTSSSSYYNIPQQQQYGQSTQANNYPFQMQQQQQAQQYRQQPYLPDKNTF